MSDTLTTDLIPVSEPFLQGRETAPAYWSGGILWLMLATFEQTNGAYSCIEELIPEGPAAPPHIHEAADETFYLIEGEATFFVGSEKRPIKATPGSFVAIPRGTIHSFRIDSPTARLLNTYVPAGFEQQIIALSVPATERTLPPSDQALSFAIVDVERFTALTEMVTAKYPAAKTINLF
ncbi:MAG: quercetin 2,3-dioxygenase [Capsulimonadales bacterium]|nr:quercetin 2,3-dioxygenase [Capsulimonadales bacterium]